VEPPAAVPSPEAQAAARRPVLERERERRQAAAGRAVLAVPGAMKAAARRSASELRSETADLSPVALASSAAASQGATRLEELTAAKH
jgi:hypothetical protein